jgi:hypothetical protein
MIKLKNSYPLSEELQRAVLPLLHHHVKAAAPAVEIVQAVDAHMVVKKEALLQNIQREP